MASASAKSGKTMNPEEIGAKFNDLRNQQRSLVGKISELEMELKEHDLVIDTLNGVQSDRKCFRMVGGVLCERQVQDVKPALEENRSKIRMVVKSLQDQMEKKGVELQQFASQHNIRLRGEEGSEPKPAEETANKSKTAGVLVADS